jgi:hypothetical protein
MVVMLAPTLVVAVVVQEVGLLLVTVLVAMVLLV